MRDWLKNTRTEKGLTMKELSKMLGISESYYCMIEKGERQKKMNLTQINGLSAALGIPVTEVIRKETEYAET